MKRHCRRHGIRYWVACDACLTEAMAEVLVKPSTSPLKDKRMKPLPPGVVDELEKCGIRVNEYYNQYGAMIWGKSIEQWEDEQTSIIGVVKDQRGCFMMFSYEILEDMPPSFFVDTIIRRFEDED